MRISGRRVLSLVAIYAIALHTILWGAGVPYAAAVDPFSVICHSAAPGEPAQAPSHSPVCDHCTLCSAMAPPAPQPGGTIAQLLPAPLLEILRPASFARSSSFSYTPNLARGPPAVA